MESKYPPKVEQSLQRVNGLVKGLLSEDYRIGYQEGVDLVMAEFAALQTKYDAILAGEDGHLSQTENVWQSGYAAGHEAGISHTEDWATIAQGYQLENAALRVKCEKMKQLIKKVHELANEGIFPHLPVETMGGQKCIEIDHAIVLTDLQSGEKEPVPQGPVWVNASDRLPGWAQVVKWRHEDGKELPGMSAVSDLSDHSPTSLEGFEWRDDENGKEVKP